MLTVRVSVEIELLPTVLTTPGSCEIQVGQAESHATASSLLTVPRGEARILLLPVEQLEPFY